MATDPELDKLRGFRLKELATRKMAAVQNLLGHPQKKAIFVAESMDEVKRQVSIKVDATCPECHQNIDIIIPKDVLKKFYQQTQIAHKTYPAPIRVSAETNHTLLSPTGKDMAELGVTGAMRRKN